MRARIKPAAPLPWLGIVRVAAAPSDGADVDVLVKDVPTVLAFGIAAAGEGGHAPLKRGLGGQAIARAPQSDI